MPQLPKTFVKGFHDAESVSKMKYNQLGKTGLSISEISLGGGTLTSLYGELEEAGAIKMIRNAIKMGINYIDTAPWYGQGKSEAILGKALKGIPREAYYIATKVGRYNLEIETQFDFTREKTNSSVDTSLKLLGLDYVDVIQIHDVEFAPSLDIVINETLPALEEVVKAGKAQYIGVTGYPLNVLKEAILRAPSRFSTVLSYTRNTLIDNTLEGYLPFLHQQQLGVICASVHGMGLLTNAGPQKWHPASDDIKDVCKKAGDYCKKNDVELGKLALHYALNRRHNVTSYLIGMQTQKLLDINMGAYFNGISRKEAEVLQYIQENYFSKLKTHHWEGFEVGNYWKILKKLSDKK